MTERHATPRLSNRERGRLDRLKERCHVLQMRINSGLNPDKQDWVQELAALSWAVAKIEASAQSETATNAAQVAAPFADTLAVMGGSLTSNSQDGGKAPRSAEEFRAKHDYFAGRVLAASKLACDMHYDLERWTPYFLPMEMLRHIQELERELSARSATAAPCEWRENVDGIYQTGCGNSFFFDTGDAVENRAKWCLYCGHELRQLNYVEPSLEEEGDATDRTGESHG